MNGTIVDGIHYSLRYIQWNFVHFTKILKIWVTKNHFAKNDIWKWLVVDVICETCIQYKFESLKCTQGKITKSAANSQDFVMK